PGGRFSDRDQNRRRLLRRFRPEPGNLLQIPPLAPPGIMKMLHDAPEQKPAGKLSAARPGERDRRPALNPGQAVSTPDGAGGLAGDRADLVDPISVDPIGSAEDKADRDIGHWNEMNPGGGT